MGAALTDQAHNQPERPYNIVVSANENEKIGSECASLLCRPRPGFQNGCTHGRQIDQTLSDKVVTTYLMVGSHPQMWTRGFRILTARTTFSEQPVRGSDFGVTYGKSFSISIPDGRGIRATCEISKNKFSFDALSLPPTLADFLTQIGSPVQSQGKWTVSYLVNSPAR